MSDYKKASRVKLRFATTKGLLAAENLWDLKLEDLNTLAVGLDEKYEASGKKSFLTEKSDKDKNLKLALDIVVDVLTTKIEENKESSESLKTKANNDRILGIIARKTDEELEGKSIEELSKMLK